MKIIVIIFFFTFYLSCNKEFSMNCPPTSYFSSDYYREDTGFYRTQRDLYTTLSEEQMQTRYTSTGLSCKEFLSRYFHCNICFGQSADLLIAYNGKRYQLEAYNSSIGFTEVVIKRLSQMQMGEEEYKRYLEEN